MRHILLCTLCLAGALLAGCGSSETLQTISVEERFRHAMSLFDDEDYLAAINEFNIITLQNQGSAYADSAQFFIAESHFRRGEWLVAATEYSYLKRSYPASPLVPEAQYKLALSYYNLSPKWMLDQQYTKKAVDEFQAFRDYYPANRHGPDADEKIKELNNRLARKAYETASLYETMEDYKAAGLSFDDVIERYHDTQYAPLAYLGKVRVLIARKRYEEARAELQKFYDRFPNSVLQSRADALKDAIEKKLQSGGSNVTGKSSDTIGSADQEVARKERVSR